MRRFCLPLLLLILVAACDRVRGDAPSAVSVIGEAPRIIDPSQKRMEQADAVLLGAVAEGLVRFDAAGQIEAGIAERWDVSDDGLYYTFRIAEDAGVDAAQAARWLRAAIRRTSRNPLRPVLDGIEEVVAVTPEVIEIRLAAPRPELLLLLAQPEMAVLESDAGIGAFRILRRMRSRIDLQRIQHAMPGEEVEPAPPLILRGERAGRAVARFAAGEISLVLGGGFRDLAIARVAGTRAETLRFDPAQGLFGLAFAHDDGFLADRDNRRAIAMAIDRDRLIAAFAVTGWQPATAIVPAGVNTLGASAQPDWATATITERRAVARSITASWSATRDTVPRLKVALPAGPGARMLFAYLRADWAAVGIEAEAVAADARQADLRLVDLVAPAPIPGWYLGHFTCAGSPVCDVDADRLIERARAVAQADQALLLAQADERLTAQAAFIPIAMPLRWSLVDRRLTGFRENVRAIHPLDHLFAEKR